MYKENVLLNYIVSDTPFLDAASLFMQDNMCPQVAHRMLKFLKEVEIAWFEWQIYSPNSNPIEHFYDRLCRPIQARTHPVNSLNSLRTA